MNNENIHISKTIHISAELLERNGFKYITYKDDFPMDDWESEDGRIIIYNDSNMIGRNWCVHVDNKDFESIGSLDVEYVHQLQQFLELCGINRIIEI